MRARRAITGLVVLAAVAAGCGTGGSSGTAKPAGDAAAAAASGSPGCSPARPTATGQTVHTFRFDGETRSYLLTVPTDYDGRTAHPLLFSFHGYTASKESQEATTGLGRAGAGRGYLVVTPDALANPRRWNTPGDPAKADDFGFVHALAADLSSRMCVDARRVYAAGHSNGSQFTAALVCRPPYIFAAEAMVSGAEPFLCPPDVTPAVLVIHGTADRNVPYRGGTVGGNTFPIVPDVVTRFAAHNHCASPPDQDQPIAGVVRARYPGCAGGADVVFDTVKGGTHPWPGGTAARADPNDSAAGKTFDATSAILDFFDAHSRIGN